MSAPQITSPGTPPDPLAPQPTFRATFYAYLQALVTAFGQANTAFDWMNTTATAVSADADAAATSATAASNSASAASGSASAAATSASEASGHADDAAAAAATATAVDAGNALLAPNNLSDVVDVPTARSNLGLATVAATGAYSDLSGAPSIPSAANDATITLSAGTGLTTGGSFTTDQAGNATITFNVDKATAANIRSSASNKVITGDGITSAAAPVTISGASNWTPDWTAFINADWEVTNDRTINNPTNVIAGTSRTVLIYGDSATERTITWGANFKNTPTDTVTSTQPLLVSLFARSSTEIVVTSVSYAS